MGNYRHSRQELHRSICLFPLSLLFMSTSFFKRNMHIRMNLLWGLGVCVFVIGGFVRRMQVYPAHVAVGKPVSVRIRLTPVLTGNNSCPPSGPIYGQELISSYDAFLHRAKSSRIIDHANETMTCNRTGTSVSVDKLHRQFLHNEQIRYLKQTTSSAMAWMAKPQHYDEFW